MRGSALRIALASLPLLGAHWALPPEARAGDPGGERATASGFPRIGNGVPDGQGAALGRLFLRLSVGNAAGGIPLDLIVTSNDVIVDPVTCSEPSDAPCSPPGHGAAGASGRPSLVLGTVTKLKLASGLYLPRGSFGPRGEVLRGRSLETALEGTLYAGTGSGEGDPCDLRLFAGDAVRMLEWGAGDEHPSRRPYEDDTGTGILLGDAEPFLFPGWVRGVVAARDADCLLADLTSSEIHAGTRPGTGETATLAPDFDRARSAGLPAGVFGRIEVNFSGLATASRVVPGAASNDVEVRVPAVEDDVRFIRGDCNGDLLPFNPLPDVMTLLGWNFAGRREPPCLAACDADRDGKVVGVVSDAIYLLQHFFVSGSPPPAPYPECGLEPEPSALGCAAEPDCP